MHVAEVAKKVLQCLQSRQSLARSNTRTNVVFRGDPTKSIKGSLPASRIKGILEINLKDGKLSAHAKVPAKSTFLVSDSPLSGLEQAGFGRRAHNGRLHI